MSFVYVLMKKVLKVTDETYLLSYPVASSIFNKVYIAQNYGLKY